MTAEGFGAAIRAALGHAPDDIQPGRLIRFPTRERSGDRSGWCRLFDDERAGVYGDWRAGIVETWHAHGRPPTPAERAASARAIAAARHERAREQRQQWQRHAERIDELMRESRPVTRGDPVERYLCRRLAVDDLAVPACLRMHPGIDYWEGGERMGTWPAMLAPLTALDGRILALHRTYLTDDGRKADLPTPKKLTGACGPLEGACIRLAQPIRGVLGVAEGIETALAASLGSGVPTVAAYCARALAGLQWRPGVQRLVIFADGDPAGREAADDLRARALRAWLRVSVLTPSDEGADWCDVWAARGAVSMGSAA